MKNHNFHKAVELLGVSKKELLHIGDHKINDMHGAISYGVDALWFNPNKEIWDLEVVVKTSRIQHMARTNRKNRLYLQLI